MKKIQKKVETVTYTDIFVSVDGREFTNEADCTEWEKSYKGTLAASWALIKKADASSVNLGLHWSSDDHECYVIEPKNLEEITLINAYIDSSTYHNGNTLTIDHIGKLVALDFGYDHDYCDVYILANHIERITNYIAELENKMHEEETK